MKNSSKLIVFMVATLAIFLVYLQVRQPVLKKLRGELEATRTLQSDLVRTNQEVAELQARYGVGAEVPVFVEQMHRYARQSGIVDDYELSSSRKKAAASGRGGGGGQSTGAGLSVSQLKISLHGEYREVAEYLRLLEEDRSPKNLLDLKMVQVKGVPKLTLNLELYSYRGPNGA